MMKIIQIFWLIWLFVSSVALSKEVDLELTTSFDSSEMFRAGQQGTFSLTVTNHGPNETGLNSTFENFTVLATSDGIDIQNDGTVPVNYKLNDESANDCLFDQLFLEPVPGDLPRVISTVFFQNLQPGQSRTCLVDFIVYEEYEHNWYGVSSNDTDPDFSNNQILFEYKMFAYPVPVLTLFPLLILLVLFSAVAFLNKDKLLK